MHIQFHQRSSSQDTFSRRTKARGSAVGALVLLAVFLVSTSSIASAQSFSRLTLDTWNGTDLAQTFDHLIIQPSGQVNSAPAGANDSQVFWWDSFGRVRLDRKNPDSPFVGYRILTIDAGTDSRFIRSTMDEFDIALGLHLGELAGWKFSTMLGVGYSSTQPFVHTTGVFGIGHLLAERSLGPNDSLVLSIDYEGNGGLLPDVPLPGFAWRHHLGDELYMMLGFPMSKIVWKPAPALEISALYTMPFSADVGIEYRLAKHFGLYANAGNFFQGFVTARSNGQPSGDVTNRQFYQMRRAEAGVRIVLDPWIDASIGLGYAFDQGFSRGFDVRDLKAIGHISDEPYLAIVLRGTF